jgi:hypothetical protein
MNERRERGYQQEKGPKGVNLIPTGDPHPFRLQLQPFFGLTCIGKTTLPAVIAYSRFPLGAGRFVLETSGVLHRIFAAFNGAKTGESPTLGEGLFFGAGAKYSTFKS